jgi:hypothetical protein
VLKELATGDKTVYELKYMPVLKFLEQLRNGKFTQETGFEYLERNGEAVK